MNKYVIDNERYFDINDFPKLSFPILDNHYLNKRADDIRKQKGFAPMFESDNEYDNNGWYDFSIECELKDENIENIELWFRVENGICNDNQISYKIEISDDEVEEIRDWLLNNKNTSEFIHDSLFLHPVHFLRAINNSYPEFYEKLFGIKPNDYQKEMLEYYYQNPNKMFIYSPLRNGRTCVDALCAVAKVCYGLYEEGEIEFNDRRL